MKGIWTGVFLLGIGAVGLSGCYVVSPYTYPPPPVQVAPGPPYVPPSARGASPAPPGGPATPPPAGGMPAPAPGANCQSVTVEGHYETRVAPGGQRETVWIPTYQQQLCR
jgi:hypothetical protein